MKGACRKVVLGVAALVAATMAGGCGSGSVGQSRLLGTPPELGTTIGSLVVVYAPETVEVEGYGLVGGLPGTGSLECPPQLRAYLKRYIHKQLPDYQIDVDRLIDSYNTAVVHVAGQMPAVSSRRRFDARVTALRGTQTTSLEGGWLYGAELRLAGALGVATRPVATAGGAIFTDRIGGSGGSKKEGYVLGGGRVLTDYKINMVLKKPDFETAGAIRNRLNERFGYGTARAITPARLELIVPPKYAKQKQRFVELVKATYLSETPELTRARILKYVKDLAVSEDKYASEIALEAIGNASMEKLSVLLNSSQERVRFHAGRCMLNLGSDEGLGALIEIALNRRSTLRVEALKALTTSALRSDAAAIARRLLSDPDFGIRVAAYEQLRKLDDYTVTSELIGRSFYLDQVASSPYQGIYAYRSGGPRIVLFGPPIRCRENLFVQSSDGRVALNAPRGQRYVTVVYKDPRRRGAITKLNSTFGLAEIIRALCEEPGAKGEKGGGGLGVSYAEMIALLKQMSDKGAISAEFRYGPLPKIGVNVKRRQTSGR